MVTQFNNDEVFWKMLVEEKVLSQDLVETHREAARGSSWVPLGRILMDEKILTMRQVMGLVAMQVDEPSLRLGDLAVREDFCTPADVQRCLEIQARKAPGPIELVLRSSDVSSDRMINALVGYIHHLEGRLEQTA